jgi:hypothetical protein
MRDPKAVSTMLRIAELYDQMAAMVERLEKRGGPAPLG